MEEANYQNIYNEREELKKYQNSCESSKNTQSSKVSNISRSMVYAIIATNWVLLYIEDTPQICNLNYWLIWSVIFSFFYIFIDIIHYFVDTCEYVCLSKKLYDSSEDIATRVKIGQKEMKAISKYSFYAIIGKTVLTFITSIVFLIGLICKIL